MNRKLRNRHRIMTTALAVIVPVIFLAGLTVRPVMPTNEKLPGVIATHDAPGRRVTIDGALFEYRQITSGQKPTAVVLAPQTGHGRLHRADVLVYWSAGNPAGQSAPVDGSFLAGTLAPQQKRTYLLPPAAASSPGYLSFYSLATKEMLPVEPALHVAPVQ